MIIINFIRNVMSEWKFFVVKNYHLAVYKYKYPTCAFHSGSIISNTSFDNYNIIFNDVIIDSCNIQAHTYIQKKATIFNADIGKFCSIASYVSIGPGMHKTDGLSTHPVFYLNNTPLIKKYSKFDLFESSKKTIIGHDVWIGEKAIIIDGITIGNGAIIAAGSVVTKNVQPYSIVGGVPAKLIRMRFDQDTIVKINEAEWWNNSDEWFTENYLLFSNTDQFVKQLNPK